MSVEDMIQEFRSDKIISIRNINDEVVLRNLRFIGKTKQNCSQENN
jgi:hypothetical protein